MQQHKINCYVCTGCAYVGYHVKDAVRHERGFIGKHSTYVTQVKIDTGKNPKDETTQIIIRGATHNINTG